MLGLALDTIALIVIVSILARQSMVDDWFRFAMLVCGLLVVGLTLGGMDIHPVMALVAYFVALCAGMRFIIGMTWLGSAIGAVLFVVYQIILAIAMGAMFSS